MKATTITAIREMLQLKVENARYHYDVTRSSLEKKYETEWLDKVITKEEKKTLDGDRDYLRRAEELLEDFENHQW